MNPSGMTFEQAFGVWFMSKKDLLKLYFKLIGLPFGIFAVIFIISIQFAETPKVALGYFLILFSLFMIVALRNFYIVLNYNDDKKKQDETTEKDFEV